MQKRDHAIPQLLNAREFLGVRSRRFARVSQVPCPTDVVSHTNEYGRVEAFGQILETRPINGFGAASAEDA